MTKIIGAPTLDDALQALTAAVAANEARGEATLVFCEDRLTLLAEQAVLDANGASFLTEVTTFRRFLNRTGEKCTIGKHGSVLATAALLGKYADSLGCFKRNAAQAVYETLAQLAASRVTEELLLESAAEVEGLLQRKLKDLALLLEKYNGFLKENGLTDENGYLALLPARIGELPPQNVIFFAFPSFTRQAQACIRAAISRHRVTGIFLAGREAFYDPEAAHIFRKVAEECGRAEVALLPVSLQGDALHMHRTLYAAVHTFGKKRTDHVRISAPRDETEEMNAVAARIRMLAAGGRRYRDIALLVGGQEYFFAVRKAFEAYKIPYYADIKRKFSEHPFCIFVLSLLGAAASGLLPDDADAIASSVYFGESGAYRNYLRRYGAFRGGALREIREADCADYADFAVLDACRERMKTVYGLFRMKGRRARGNEYTAAIRALWKAVDGERVTQDLAARLPAEERAFLDISRLETMLSETERVVGEETFDAREFASILKSGMDALTVSVLPRCADAVFVGDVTESRIRRSPVLFIAGLTEELPRVSQDTAVISDGEIRVLGKLQVELDPEIAVVNARAKEAFALNLCAFSEELYLSCPVRKGGKETARSDAFYYIERAFDAAPMSEVYPFDCCEYTPALLAFFRDLDAAGEGAERIARCSSVRAVLMDPPRKDWPSGDPDLLRARREKGESEEAGELWKGLSLSPTQLETYFDCPYKGFAMRALRISETEERTLLDGAERGTFLHAVLEQMGRRFNEIAEEETVRKETRQAAEALLQTPRFAAVADTKAGAYMGVRLVEDAVNVTAAAYLQLKGSAYEFASGEVPIEVPSLGLKGKADRVDIAREQGGEGKYVRVIDYKTGSIGKDAADYYTGRKLQLPLYLRAVSEAEGGRAAGAFYFPAADNFTEDAKNKFRMKGFFCKDEDVVMGMDCTRAQRVSKEGKVIYEASKFFESGSGDALPREEFERFLDYAGLVAVQAKAEMGSGNIAPSPYENACGHCKLKGMCGFVGDARGESAVTAAEIADIAGRAEAAGQEAAAAEAGTSTGEEEQ